MVGRMGAAPPPRPNSQITLPELRECKISRYTYPYAFFNLEQPHIAWTHNGCWCNDYIALRYRHQVATPCLDKDEHLHQPRTHLWQLLGPKLQPMKRWKVVRSYRGPWRAKYAQAQLERDETGLQHRHRNVRLFNKSDLEMAHPSKAPRAIQYRHPIFGLEQARYTKPLEKWFYAIKDEYGTNIVGKSDPFTIAKCLQTKSSFFANPAFLMLDASKFDSCVDIKWLQLCADFYCAMFPHTDTRRIRWLWSRTLQNNGKSRSGVKYKTSGTRMSGDMDTGLGNSIIMWSLLKTYLVKAQIFKHSILVNGDDSIVVIEQSQLSQARDLSVFKQLGFNMKFEVALEFNQLEFCQSKPVLSDYGWTMARNPLRVMGRTSWSVNNYGKRKMRAFVHTLGLCERAASWGMPIASHMATAMIQATPGAARLQLSPWLEDHYNRMQRWWKLGKPIISIDTRNNFAESWGISPTEQVRIEQSILVRVLSKPTVSQLLAYDDLVRDSSSVGA